MPVGVKGFQKGAAWNGNRNGAPKKQFHRDDFTDELFHKYKDRIDIVADRLTTYAIEGNPWAMKLVCDYFLTRPKNRDEFENTNQAIAFETFAGFRQEALIKIQDIMLEEMKHRGEA